MHVHQNNQIGQSALYATYTCIYTIKKITLAIAGPLYALKKHGLETYKLVMVFVVRKINYFGTFAIDSLKLFLLPNFNLAFAFKMQSID